MSNPDSRERRCTCQLERAEGCCCGKGPLESSCMQYPHDLDARALKKRLEDRDVIIGVLRDRCMTLEVAVKDFLENELHHAGWCDCVNQTGEQGPCSCRAEEAALRLRAALEVLPPVKP